MIEVPGQAGSREQPRVDVDVRRNEPGEGGHHADHGRRFDAGIERGEDRRAATTAGQAEDPDLFHAVDSAQHAERGQVVVRDHAGQRRTENPGSLRHRVLVNGRGDVVRLVVLGRQLEAAGTPGEGVMTQHHEARAGEHTGGGLTLVQVRADPDRDPAGPRYVDQPLGTDRLHPGMAVQTEQARPRRSPGRSEQPRTRRRSERRGPLEFTGVDAIRLPLVHGAHCGHGAGLRYAEQSGDLGGQFVPGQWQGVPDEVRPVVVPAQCTGSHATSQGLRNRFLS